MSDLGEVLAWLELATAGADPGPTGEWVRHARCYRGWHGCWHYSLAPGWHVWPHNEFAGGSSPHEVRRDDVAAADGSSGVIVGGYLAECIAAVEELARP